MKSDNRKKAGALQPIPLPERAWQQITTDLVTNLPESEGKTAIAVLCGPLDQDGAFLSLHQGDYSH